ncbi:MAG: hypothetical protein JOZ09_07110 [Pseudonocardiales bacterium]|jgi:hypothetical protein|nr:hypothetical protein [Pseudonocardiales bacterium]
MGQQEMEQHGTGADLEELHSEIPHDAEQFAVGLEDDRKLHKVWLIAGLLSEATLIGMFITSLEEPGPAWPVVLAILVVGLGVAMVVHLAQFRVNGQPRARSGQRRRSKPAH